jgi:hypothetical protein
MKETQIHNPDNVKPDIEIRQAVKSAVPVLRFKPQNGQKIYEMIIVPRKDGDVVKGFNPEDGSFDPELADVVEAEYKLDTMVVGIPVVEGLGPVKPSKRGKLVIVDGNIYEVAINVRIAREKMIRKYFPKQ